MDTLIQRWSEAKTITDGVIELCEQGEQSVEEAARELRRGVLGIGPTPEDAEWIVGHVLQARDRGDSPEAAAGELLRAVAHVHAKHGHDYTIHAETADAAAEGCPGCGGPMLTTDDLRLIHAGEHPTLSPKPYEVCVHVSEDEIENPLWFLAVSDEAAFSEVHDYVEDHPELEELFNQGRVFAIPAEAWEQLDVHAGWVSRIEFADPMIHAGRLHDAEQV